MSLFDEIDDDNDDVFVDFNPFNSRQSAPIQDTHDIRKQSTYDQADQMVLASSLQSGGQRQFQVPVTGHQQQHRHELKLNSSQQANSDKLLRSLGHKVAQIFPRAFNQMQQAVFDKAFLSDENLVVSSPTGSGKTTVMELALARLLRQGGLGNHVEMSSLAAGASVSLPSTAGARCKALFISPAKALCQQRLLEWRSKFEDNFGVRCVEITGDTEKATSFASALSSADILFTTPEKLDASTRRSGDGNILKNVRLLLLDEVHIIGEDRGATLECCVSRIEAAVSRFQSEGKKLRIVAISATLPNIIDIGSWLRCKNGFVVSFGEEFRPIRLDRVVISYPPSKNDFLFDRNLNYRLFDHINNYSMNRPTLVFCATRNSAIQAAQQLAKDIRGGRCRVRLPPAAQQQLRSASASLNNAQLRDCIVDGVGFHSAGLSMNDRRVIESLFERAVLPVLCTTRTLALGVNLPCHLVVIKGTSFWNDTEKKYSEYEFNDVLQMIGRAGRPQFDSSGTALILTEQKFKSKWENVSSGTYVLESHLYSNMIAFLNAEISSGIIATVQDAIEWLKSTFLFCRLRKNPTFYGLPSGISDKLLEQKLEDFLRGEMQKLQKAKMITIDSSGAQVYSTDIGHLMSRFYINFDTMQILDSIDANADIEDVLTAACRSSELQNNVLRRSDKAKLNDINKNIKYKFDGKVKQKEEKVEILVQAQLGGIKVDDFGMRNEIGTINRHLTRIIRCLVELATHKRAYGALQSAIVLSKCLKRKMWDDNLREVMQLPNVGEIMFSTLAAAGITTISAVASTPSFRLATNRVEAIVNRRPPFGQNLIQAALDIPDISLSVKTNRKSVGTFDISLILGNRSADHDGFASFNHNKSLYKVDSHYLLLGDADSGKLLFHRKIATQHIGTRAVVVVSVTRENNEAARRLTAKLISNEWIGRDKSENLRVIFDEERYQLEEQWKSSNTTSSNTGTGKKNGSTDKERGASASGTKPVKPCRHQCADKRQCKHRCCKRGLPPAPQSATAETYVGGAGAAAAAATSDNAGPANAREPSGFDLFSFPEEPVPAPEDSAPTRDKYFVNRAEAFAATQGSFASDVERFGDSRSYLSQVASSKQPPSRYLSQLPPTRSHEEQQRLKQQRIPQFAGNIGGGDHSEHLTNPQASLQMRAQMQNQQPAKQSQPGAWKQWQQQQQPAVESSKHFQAPQHLSLAHAPYSNQQQPLWQQQQPPPPPPPPQQPQLILQESANSMSDDREKKRFQQLLKQREQEVEELRRQLRVSEHQQRQQSQAFGTFDPQRNDEQQAAAAHTFSAPTALKTMSLRESLQSLKSTDDAPTSSEASKNFSRKRKSLFASSTTAHLSAGDVGAAKTKKKGVFLDTSFSSSSPFATPITTSSSAHVTSSSADALRFPPKSAPSSSSGAIYKKPTIDSSFSSNASEAGPASATVPASTSLYKRKKETDLLFDNIFGGKSSDTSSLASKNQDFARLFEM